MQALSKRRIFYGWWIVAVSIIVNMFHAGAAFYSFGRFMPTLIAEFESTTAAIAAAASIYMLVMGIAGAAAGKLTDIYGPKKVIILGSIIAAAALMLLSVVNAVWQIYILYGLVGVGMGGCGWVPTNVAISNWFTKRRGLAVGISMVGISLGAMLLAPLAGYLIELISWQAAFLILGLLTAVLVIPSVLFVMKTRPQDMGLLPDGATPSELEPTSEMASQNKIAQVSNVNEEGWMLSQAARSFPFWMMLIAFFLSGMVVAGILQHEVNFLSLMGIPITTATFALGFTGGIGGVGKVAFGYLADRLSPRYTTVICFALQLAGVGVLLMTHSPAMVWVFVFLYGFAMGGNIAVQPLVTGQLFGTAAFGAIFGWVAFAGPLGSALGPVVGGVIYDASGSYTTAFFVFLAVYAAAIVAILLARRPRLSRINEEAQA